MKKLELNQMEIVNGGGRPSGGQVTCYVIRTVMGILNPFAGIAIGAMCLFVD